jgi:hypothetical protein
MKNLKQKFRKRQLGYAFALVLAGGALLAGAAQHGGGFTHAAGSDTMYLSPSGGTHKVGTTFSVAIRENSNSDSVNAVEADLTYSTSKLQFVSTSLSGTAFGITASNTGGGGSISVSLGSVSAVTGDKLIATVTFKALAAGSGTVSVSSGSQVLSSTTNTNIVSNLTGGAYTIQSATTTSPPPSSGSGGTTTAKPPTTQSAKPSGSATPTTSIAPKNNPKAITIPNNAKVELNDQATIQTTPPTTGSGAKSVTKVAYYLNNKLVATVTKTPYNYSVNTESLRNGNYTLTSKTYYADGAIATKNTALIVKNPFDWTQFKLQLQHYILYIAVLVLLIGGAAWIYLRRGTNRWGGSMHTDFPAAGGTPPTPHVGIM